MVRALDFFSGCNPNFVDSIDETCEDYINKGYCSSNGGYGEWWPYGRTFEQYANANGETASVCPQCGCKAGNL